MNFTEYYSNKMTEALDKKEGEMWRDFYTTILPRRIKKFKKKYGLCTCKTTDIRI